MELQSNRLLGFSLSAGALAALLYALTLSGGFFSLLMAYTPLLPLMAIGLAFGPRASTIAALCATLLSGLAIGLSGMLIFGMIYAVPVMFFIHIALATANRERWYPIGGALTGLSLYAAIIAGLLIALLLPNPEALGDVLSKSMGEDPNAEWMQPARELMTNYPFLIFSIALWMQILVFYGISIFINYMLTGWNYHIRPSLRLTSFMPSIFILGVMLLCGIATFSGSPSMQLAGKTTFTVLLLPYFLMGIAQMHVRARKWPQAKWWLFTIYTVTALVFWPVFWFIGAGLFEQAKFLSNHSSDGTEK